MGRPRSSWLYVLGIASAAFVLLLALAGTTLWQSSLAAPQISFLSPHEGQVVGLEFDGRMVSDLDKSVAFYKLLGFTEVPGLDKSWRNDPVMNRIHGLKDGVRSRMAKLTINTNMGEQKPFTLYLREFKGMKRRNVMGGHPAWTPGATHIDLTVPDADEMWSKLKAANMLWSRTWDSKLIAAPVRRKALLPT